MGGQHSQFTEEELKDYQVKTLSLYFIQYDFFLFFIVFFLKYLKKVLGLAVTVVFTSLQELTYFTQKEILQ